MRELFCSNSGSDNEKNDQDHDHISVSELQENTNLRKLFYSHNDSEKYHNKSEDNHYEASKNEESPQEKIIHNKILAINSELNEERNDLDNLDNDHISVSQMQEDASLRKLFCSNDNDLVEEKNKDDNNDISVLKMQENTDRRKLFSSSRVTRKKTQIGQMIKQ